MKESKLWKISFLTSTVLLGILMYMWVQMNTSKVDEDQLESRKAALAHLDKEWEKDFGDLLKIKTGVFIQSMQFSNSYDVNLTGYIWQRYGPGVRDSLGLDSLDVGFILPEQINSGSDIEPREVYRLMQGDEELVGWYFEATLRQPFDYRSYPFDHQSVWIRMWPKNFADNVVLIPDYESYTSTSTDSIFGIEDEIVLGGWKLLNTFFNYKESDYDTDFGIKGYQGQDGFPELHYNLLVKREVENSFFVYILPLFLFAVLLFALLLTVSKNIKNNNHFGFSTNNFVATSSALFFVMMLSHIQLRQQFEGGNIVYMDCFYILMYAMMVLLIINVYLFSLREKTKFATLINHDNLLMKISYWPLILGSLIIITLFYYWDK